MWRVNEVNKNDGTLYHHANGERVLRHEVTATIDAHDNFAEEQLDEMSVFFVFL